MPRALAGLLILSVLSLPGRADDEPRSIIPGCRTFKVQHGDPTTGVALGPNGKYLASCASDGSVKLWDLSGKELRTIAAHDSMAGAIVFTPDGRGLISTGHDRLIKLWDPQTGKRLATFRGHAGPVTAIAVATDGKTIASGSWDKTIRLWDLKGAKEIRAFKGHEGVVSSVAFSAGGDAIVSGSWDRSIRVWDVNGGERELVNHEDAMVFDVRLSDRTMAACGGYAALRFWEPSGRGGLGARKFWDPAWQFRAGPKGIEGPVFHIALSPDGRTLAAAGAFRLVQLWEVASGRERAVLDAPAAKSAGVAFDDDGRWLAAAGEDGTIRAWELIATTPHPRGTLADEKLRSLWGDMGGAAGAPAYRAILTLSAHPSDAVPFLKERVKPVGVAEPERIARLLKGLDSEDFTARQQAEQELERMSEQAGPALRKALEEPIASLEVRRRIERLVQKLNGRMLPLEQLQAIRGIEVLESIRNPEARAVLERIAAGAPGRLTAEAKSSLRRLSQSSRPK
jgi:WD40 repeat protein